MLSQDFWWQNIYALKTKVLCFAGSYFIRNFRIHFLQFYPFSRIYWKIFSPGNWKLKAIIWKDTECKKFLYGPICVICVPYRNKCYDSNLIIIEPVHPHDHIGIKLASYSSKSVSYRRAGVWMRIQRRWLAKPCFHPNPLSAGATTRW